MPDILDDDFVPTPPAPERIAARALVLASVCCRASLEDGVGQKEAEDLWLQILPWLDEVGASYELEQREREVIATPLGKLDPRRAVDSGWEAEAMVTLAWVLQCASIPDVYTQCDSPAIGDDLGFLCNRSETPLENPTIRNSDEIDRMRNTYLSLHWRLRQFSMDSEFIDFREFARKCQWAEMRLDELEIVDGDLAIDGKRLKDASCERFREVLSITQVRHQALNWLLGIDVLYSQVTTDT